MEVLRTEAEQVKVNMNIVTLNFYKLILNIFCFVLEPRT